jgi:hypothetical protein
MIVPRRKLKNLSKRQSRKLPQFRIPSKRHQSPTKQKQQLPQARK